MAEQDSQKSALATRDQLGRQDKVNTVGVWDFKEQVGIEEGPTKVAIVGIGTALIFNHATNGKLNSGYVYGPGGKAAEDVKRVINPDNIFKEHFRDTTYQDSTNGAASWDTTNFRWEFGKDDQGQTKAIFKDVKSVSTVTPLISMRGVTVTFVVDKMAFSGGKEVNIT